MLRRIAVSMMMAAVLSAPAWAQNAKQPLPLRIFKKLPPKQKAKVILQAQKQLERVSKMSPEDRQKFLDSLPPARRALIEQRLKNYEQMSPEERQRLENQVQQFQQLPEQRQARVRQLFNRFETFPPRRKLLLSQELQRLRAMDEERRAQRISNPRFQQVYTAAEIEWLTEITEALDAAPAQ